MRSLFISDLHLSEKRPLTTKLFLTFLQTEALHADSLYILGDFFDVWLGMDLASAHDLHVIACLKAYSEQGRKLYFMVGNRDFLIVSSFAALSGASLLPDPSLIQMGSQRVLLMHGDLLCTNDIGYQRYRKIVYNPLIQTLFLKLPACIRLKIAAKLRQGSRNTQATTQDLIKWMAVPKTIDTYIAEFKADKLIHGHTHLALMEDKRIVLNEWHEDQGMYLSLENGQYQCHTVN